MELAVMFLLTAVLAAAIVRILTLRDLGAQAMILEFGFMAFVAILVALGSALRSDVVFDLLLIAAVIGFLFTMALARLLARGQR